MARRGKENFRFSTVELGALAVSYTITSVLVFLLGFYVGRKVAAEHAPVAENVARVPVGAPPSETAAPRPASRTAQPGAAPAPSAVAPAAATTAAAAAVAAKSPPPTTSQQIPASQAIAKSSGASAAALTPPAPVRAPGAVAPPPPAGAAPALNLPPGVPFTVQVLATRNRSEADTLSTQLKRKGFGAYVAAVEDANGTWYRVRIGHFDDPETARRTAERASKEHGLTQAYVSPIYSDAR